MTSEQEDAGALHGASAPKAQGLFEAHLTVRNLKASIDFYTRVVGLQIAYVVPSRAAAFLWIGSPGQSMLGLWESGSGPQQMTLHLAFREDLADVIASPRLLQAAGVTPLDFDGHPTAEPVVIAWMPAASVFFRDPDGHLLEFIAMLPDAPRPESGVIPWHEWEAGHEKAVTTHVES